MGNNLSFLEFRLAFFHPTFQGADWLGEFWTRFRALIRDAFPRASPGVDIRLAKQRPEPKVTQPTAVSPTNVFRNRVPQSLAGVAQ